MSQIDRGANATVEHDWLRAAFDLAVATAFAACGALFTPWLFVASGGWLVIAYLQARLARTTSQMRAEETAGANGAGTAR